MGYSADANEGSVLVMVEKDAAFGDYTIMVTNGKSGDAEVTQELTIFVAGPPVEYMVDPMATYIPLRGRATFTVTAMDEMGGVPSFTTNDDTDTQDVDERDHMVKIDAPYGDVRGTMIGSADALTLSTNTGMGTFTYTLPRDAEQGELFSIFIGEGDMQVEVMVTAGMEPTVPGMPMNVSAMATSHDMIAVSWESPADDGGSDITGYVLQSKTGMMDFMTIAASSAEVWWNTLDCPMMNAEIPDDATPAPPEDDTDMTSPYCAMYAGLSAEATTVVDGVFADEYGTISGTSHSDMGLMAETTYYYRVSAINSVGKGEYSDGMAMAMTMMAPSMELGDPVVTGAMSDAAGEATIMITPGANADQHWIWAQPTDLSEGMFSDRVAGDATSFTMSGLTSGMSYWFTAVAGRGEKGAEEWSEYSGWSAETPIE